MSRELHSSVRLELSAAHIKYMFMVDLQLDSGSIAFNGSLSNYDYDEKIFVGAGNLGSVSSVTEDNNLDPSSCSITLSAVNQALLSAFLDEEILNRKAIVYVALLDESNQIIGEPFVYFDGLMEPPKITYGNSATILIDIKDRLAIWNRDKTQHLTNEEQIKQHPSDKGLEFVNAIASKEIVWPASTWRGSN